MQKNLAIISVTVHFLKLHDLVLYVPIAEILEIFVAQAWHKAWDHAIIGLGLYYPTFRIHAVQAQYILHTVQHILFTNYYKN
jgi:hypothetical protein